MDKKPGYYWYTNAFDERELVKIDLNARGILEMERFGTEYTVELVQDDWDDLTPASVN